MPTPRPSDTPGASGPAGGSGVDRGDAPRQEQFYKDFFESWVLNERRKLELKEDGFLPFPDDGADSKAVLSQNLLKEWTSDLGSPDMAGSRLRADQLLNDADIQQLYEKVARMLTPSGRPERSKGFSLYDTKDEEGLHEDAGFSDQEDYDLSEVHDDLAHIEVEVDGCSGHDGQCSCDEYDELGPSCEFTFEYDHKGQLVPTSNNVEEQLRLMQLQSQSQPAPRPSKGKKKKSKKKKAKPESSGPGCHCLFCEYEAVYGVEPRQMIKWYDQTVRREEARRTDIKRKLEKVKNSQRRREGEASSGVKGGEL